jgi:two-component system sensor histidine kinase YesM
MVIVVISGLLFYHTQVSRAIIQRNLQYTGDLFDHVQHNTTQRVEMLVNLWTTLAFSPTVQEYMAEVDQLQRYENSQSLRRLMAYMATFTYGVVDIAIVPINGPSQSNSGTAVYLADLGRQITAASSPEFSELINLRVGPDSTSEAVLLVRGAAVSTDSSAPFGAVLGEVILVVRPNAVVPDLVSCDPNLPTTYYVLDRAGQSIPVAGSADCESLDRFDNQTIQDLLGNPSSDGPYIVRSAPLPGLDGSIVAITPRARLLSEVTRLRNVMVISLGIGVALLAFPLLLMFRNVTHPIEQLTEFIGRAKSQDPRQFDERIKLKGFREVAELASEFNNMLEDNAKLTANLLEARTRAYDAELLERKAEIRMLQSQINPHFLYNTLETIVGLSHNGRSQDIATITRSLGRIYRYSAQSGGWVSLREEVEVAKSYMDIQLLRFGSRFRAEFDIPESCQNVRIPRMILQPLVENAVVHGLETLKAGGLVAIISRMEREELIIEVRDNGTGIDDDTLQALRGTQESPRAVEEVEQDQHIGFSNVKNRLALMYRGRARLVVESNCGAGTLVRVAVPLERGADV